MFYKEPTVSLICLAAIWKYPSCPSLFLRPDSVPAIKQTFFSSFTHQKSEEQQSWGRGAAS